MRLTTRGTGAHGRARRPRPRRRPRPGAGGAEGETLRPLDIAPDPGRPARAFLDRDAVAADLRRVADDQREDGGWTVDYLPISPAGSLDWRGYATVKAIATLRRNDAL